MEQNVEWAKTLKPLTAEELKEQKERTVATAMKWGAHLDRLDPKGEKNRPLIHATW